MIDSKSRYANCGTATLRVAEPDGTYREIKYVLRRFIPDPEAMTVIVEHSFNQGERLDNIAAQYLGDPTQFWRICDANGVMNPEELEEIGRSIKIAITTT